MAVSNPVRSRPTSLLISVFSPESLGLALRPLSGTQAASATFPVANLAILIPFRLREATTFVKAMVYNGATASGNWDVGIYSSSGARLASTGTTAQSGTSTTQEATLSYTAVPGAYYMALAADGTTGTFMTTTVVAASASALGITQAATAFVLPTSPTLAAFAQVSLPVFGISRRTLTS